MVILAKDWGRSLESIFLWLFIDTRLAFVRQFYISTVSVKSKENVPMFAKEKKTATKWWWCCWWQQWWRRQWDTLFKKMQYNIFIPDKYHTYIFLDTKTSIFVKKLSRYLSIWISWNRLAARKALYILTGEGISNKSLLLSLSPNKDYFSDCLKILFLFGILINHTN